MLQRWRSGRYDIITTSRDYGLILLGAVLQAIGIVVFQAPAELAAGGVSGLAVIANHLIPAIPIGAVVLVLNIPLLALGIRSLGGWRFFVRTVVTVILYSVSMLILAAIGAQSLTHDIVLNTLFGAIIGGAGSGLVFRAKGTTGGTDILTLVLSKWKGIPLSQGYLITDALVILAAGLIFGWEKALYALIALYVSGLVAETIAEGVGINRAVTVITTEADRIAAEVSTHMGRGVTRWAANGAYTGLERHILYIVVSRAEISILNSIITDIDPHAFVVVGQVHEVYGEGFKQFERR
ncbi:MAG: YitT family protein [Chloroflexi bacterium]|nr:YitT family protein [Chloroflexota bacterium]MCL5273600.1 YitT family protein [Chloroflexota bacterium]